MTDLNLRAAAPPDITVEKTWVHASEGFDIDLVCIVHGDVNSEMLWYQNSFLLDPTDRRSMYSRGDKYTLNIRNFQQSDFGNYSCVADNALGRTKKYIEVSGRPGPAAFQSPAYSNYLDRYNLTYTIESIPPLDEIKLLYRKLMISDIHQFYTRNFDLTPNELEFVMSSISNSGYRKPFSSELSVRMLATCFMLVLLSFSLANR
uniref:Ig-like domain-containing protein n=1 Tax=Anopheles coluzzii TaxID=1518534 RepID=A0A8W7PW24_ANOCL